MADEDYADEDYEGSEDDEKLQRVEEHSGSTEYLSTEDEGEAGARFWEAVCREWDRRQGDAARKLTRFKFFTLRAPLLPGGGYGPVSKSLVREHTCSEPAD